MLKMTEENQQMIQMHSQTPPQLQPLQSPHQLQHAQQQQQQTQQQQHQIQQQQQIQQQHQQIQHQQQQMQHQQQQSMQQPVQQQQQIQMAQQHPQQSIAQQPQQQIQPQQTHVQQQQQPPQVQQQAVAVTMSLPNNMDQTGHINQPNSIALSTGMNVSQAQTMGSSPVTVNNTGQQVHMAVPQLTAQPQNAAPTVTAVMSQSSAQHPTMIHPAMSMAQSPLQQVQVLQQPLSASYLQQLYTPQQQMLFPGNLTLQHTGTGAPTLQSIVPAQGLSLQLQTTKTNMDPKASGAAGQTLQAANKGLAFSTSNMMTTAAGQVIGTGTKANFQQQVMAAPGKSTIIHGQPQFAPGNANQTVVISQLLPNQQSVFNQKTLADTHKGKTYMVNQQATLQPKSPLFSSALPPHSSAQIFNGNQLKQLTSSPQLITSQAPGAVFSQAQLLGSLQALGASLPQGISWATPNLQSSALLAAQNPIFIRQQSDMYIQSPQQTAVHLPVAAASAPLPPTTYASASLVPQKQKQVRPGSSVATQTMVSSVATVHANTPPFRSQMKAKPRTISSHLTTATTTAQLMPQMATTQTQTNQLHSQMPPPVPMLPQHPLPHQHQQQQTQLQQMPLPQFKTDAANQTRPIPEMKSIATQSKSIAVEAKQQSPPVMKTQAKVAPTTKQTIDASMSTSVPLSSVPCSIVSPTISTMTVATTVASPVTVNSLPQITNIETLHVDEPEEPVAEGTTFSVSDIGTSAHEEVEVRPAFDNVQEFRHLSQVAKERQPQKAIVKPHILTHVIDGYVIQEGPEPFPVSRSSLLTETSPPKPVSMEVSNSSTEPSKVVTSEKKKKIHRVRGPVELAKCEFCGKLGAKSKFKRSKRFCSTSCAKRYNVCCSKRLGLLSTPQQENLLGAGKIMKKKKPGMKARKGWRKAEGGRLTYNVTQWVCSVATKQQHQAELLEKSATPMDESASVEVISKPSNEEDVESPLGSEESSEATASSQPGKEAMEIDMTETHPVGKAPNKWTVQEVFEFIRDLAGCSDYADEFRSQEIDGQALLLLKEDHLMSAIGMKLGPALKLIARINNIKEEISHT